MTRPKAKPVLAEAWAIIDRHGKIAVQSDNVLAIWNCEPHAGNDYDEDERVVRVLIIEAPK